MEHSATKTGNKITPHNFKNVGQYYKDFTQITEEQVIEILKRKTAMINKDL